MRLRYTRPALSDLNSILDYIAIHSPHGAARVHARIDAVVDLLRTHPHIGAATDDPTIRHVNTSPYPYLIFYEVAGAEIGDHETEGPVTVQAIMDE